MDALNGILTDRAVIDVSGPEASSLLQGLITQDVDDAKPPENGVSGAIFACLLTPQGKILFEFHIVPYKDGFLFDCSKDAEAALLKRLKLYKLRADVSLQARADLRVGVTMNGEPPDAAVCVFDDPRLPALGRRYIVEMGDPPENTGQEDTTQAFRAHRLSYGVPEFGTDFEADDVFLMDVNYDVLGGVSYKKGCFVGQEVTSRMKRKGAVRKRTWCVKGPGLSSKAEITGPNGPIGAVTAAVDGVGLAIVRVDRVAAAGDCPFAVNGETVSLTPPAYLEDDPQ